MVGLEYLRMEEVQALPQRQEPFGVLVYSPLAQLETIIKANQALEVFHRERRDSA